MSDMHKVTVSLMTRNRPHYLREAMASILSQKGIQLELLVFDNASDHETAEVIRSFNDSRITHFRSETDIGIMRNWNRAIDVGRERSPFVSIFHDDDIMLPEFLAQSIRALDENPTAGVCLSLTEFIDKDGNFVETPHPNEIKPGLNRSLDLIELIVQGRAMLIFPPTGLFRAEVLKRIGPADSPHTRSTCDMNHWHRAFMDSDVYFIPKVLTRYRQHEGTDTHLLHQTTMVKALGWYGVMVENADLIAHLLRSERATKPEYRQWLAERVLWIHLLQSQSLHQACDEIYHSHENRLALFRDWLERTLPPATPFILIDDALLELEGTMNGRRIIPFIECDGQYWGHPRDVAHAIDELERLRRTGVQWLVVAWPCRWWLDEYGDFERHLRKHHHRVLDFPHGVVFQLRDPKDSQHQPKGVTRA